MSKDSTGSSSLENPIKSYFMKVPKNTAILCCAGSRRYNTERPDSDWNFIAYLWPSFSELFKTYVGNKVTQKPSVIMDTGGTLQFKQLSNLIKGVESQLPSVLDDLHSIIWVDPLLELVLPPLVDDLVDPNGRAFNLAFHTAISQAMTNCHMNDPKSLARYGTEVIRLCTQYHAIKSGASYRESMLFEGPIEATKESVRHAFASYRTARIFKVREPDRCFAAPMATFAQLIELGIETKFKEEF